MKPRWKFCAQSKDLKKTRETRSKRGLYKGIAVLRSHGIDIAIVVGPLF
jgi:hypothetical protein